MIRPLAEDLQVKTLYGYGRDWQFSYAELEPWLQQAEVEIGVAGGDDNPYATHRSGPYPMPAHPFSYFRSRGPSSWMREPATPSATPQPFRPGDGAGRGAGGAAQWVGLR